MSKTNNKVIKRDMSTFNIVFTVIVVITNILFSFVLFNLTQYSTLSKKAFIISNVIILLLLLTLNIVFILTIRTRKSTLFNIFIALSVILFGVGVYGTYAMVNVNVNIDKIVDEGPTSETVETSLVVYSDSGEYLIKEEVDLEGKTLGVVSGSNNYNLAKEHLETNDVKVSYAEFNDNNELLLALFNGEINAAALPSNYVGIFEVNDGYDVLLEDTKVISTFSSVVQVETTVASDKDITKEPFTVLILGVDEGRSDAVILASVNPISMKVTMSSLARDSYVPIACYGGKASDKLGHARVRSRQCTIDTVSQLIGVPIDYYFESNFKGIVEMVDALGGIVVNNPYEFVGQSSSTQRGHYTVWVPAGTDVPLNGEQALAFARERHLYASGDFQRQANQQQVVRAILTKAMRTSDLNQLLNVLKAAGDNFSTNLTVDQLIDLFNHVSKKAGRYYDDSHPENTILIQGSRVTGYNSGIWNEAAQLRLSIVRLFEGSIKDTKDAIMRNIDMDSEITAPKSWRWDANWVFIAPTISNETYSEQRIIDEMPDIVINFTGQSLGQVQGWAASRGINIYANYIDCAATNVCGGFGDGIVIEQSVRPGIKTSNVSDITVGITSSTGTAAPEQVPTEEPEATPDAPKPGVYTVIVRYVIADGGVAAPGMYQGQSNADGSYNVTSPHVEGYTPSNAVISGTAYGNVDVTVTYTKNQTPPPEGGTDPGGTDPGGTDPGGTDPGGTDPGGTDPGGTDPGGTDPGGTDPGGTDPGGTDPGGTDPGGTDPGGTDPGGDNP